MNFTREEADGNASNDAFHCRADNDAPDSGPHRWCEPRRGSIDGSQDGAEQNAEQNFVHHFLRWSQILSPPGVLYNGRGNSFKASGGKLTETRPVSARTT